MLFVPSVHVKEGEEEGGDEADAAGCADADADFGAC